jgi:hypothetical protein
MDSDIPRAITDNEGVELSPQTSAVELCVSSKSPGITILLMEIYSLIFVKVRATYLLYKAM